MTPHRINPTIYQFTFGPNQPVATIVPGDRIIAETRDARGDDKNGAPIPEEMKQRQAGTTLCQSNPLVGPVYVEGAEPGNLLAVTIEKIQLNRDYAFSKQSSCFGSLTGEGPGKIMTYNDPIPDIEYRWKLDIEKNTGLLDMPGSRIGQAEVSIEPFIGSIGVAPRYGRIEMSLAPGEFGGNMDFRQVAQGTILYLPVWVEGAYLSFGDIHALQGDGEVNGTALETTAEVTLKVDLVQNPTRRPTGRAWRTGNPSWSSEAPGPFWTPSNCPRSKC